MVIAFDSFKNVLRQGWYNEFVCVVKHVFLVEAIVLFYLFTTQDTSIYSRISFYVMILLYIGISYAVRCLWKLQLRKRAARDSKVHTAIIVGGMLGSIMALLIIIVVKPMIYIASPGKIIFTQERIGRNGRCFKMYKLRSMYMDAEERKKDLKIIYEKRR